MKIILDRSEVKQLLGRRGSGYDFVLYLDELDIQLLVRDWVEQEFAATLDGKGILIDPDPSSRGVIVRVVRGHQRLDDNSRYEEWKKGEK